MALNSTFQDDFSASMYRGRRAPGNAVYDLLNGLINDEGLAFKRGGSAYKSGADAGSTLEGLADAYLAGGQRTVFWSETGEDVYTLASDDSTVVTVSGSGTAIRKNRRGVVFHGLLWMPASKILGSTALGPVVGYGGSRKTSDPTTATMDVTNGSTTVTASGTSWLTTADAGMVLERTTGLDLGVGGVVRSVTSDTALELVDPWTRTTDTGVGGNLYRLHEGPPLFTDDSTDPVYVATAGRRLLVAQERRVYYTPRDSPWGGDRHTDYHELPEGALITGADALQDVGVIFTTGGVWGITNLVLDDVDDFGNIQQSVQQISKDLILWGDPGIASWSSALVVPGVDDVFVFKTNGSLSAITGERGSKYDGGIRNLYRDYVSQGFQPGTATVHRSHYILPILDGTDLVDVLVCRLDHGFAWTRWSAGAAGVSYARRIGSDTRSPKLLGLAGQRVTDLTGCFDPTASNATDADGTAPTFQVTTRDYPTGQQPGFVDRVRARYEMVGLGIPDTFDRPDGDIGPDWTTPVWGDSNSALEIASHELAGNSAGHDSRSYYTADPQVAPLATGFTFKARPAGNVDTFVYATIGFRRADTTSGYEARFRFESAADQVAIYRYDGGSATRILDPVALGGRLAADDTFGFSVGTDGTISVLVNNAVVGSVTDTTHFHAGEAGYALAGVVDVTGVQSLIRLDGAAPAVVDVEFSSDQDGGVFTALTERGEQFGGTGWTVSDGSKYQFAKVGKKRERIRFRVTVAGACTSFVLRSLEMLTRPSGRQ